VISRGGSAIIVRKVGIVEGHRVESAQKGSILAEVEAELWLSRRRVSGRGA
jgi:hypothetical protein